MQCPHCSQRIARTDRICPACRRRIDTGEEIDLALPGARKRRAREHASGSAQVRMTVGGPISGTVRALVRGGSRVFVCLVPGSLSLKRMRPGQGVGWFAAAAGAMWLVFRSPPELLFPALVLVLSVWGAWVLEVRNDTGRRSIVIVGFLLTGVLLWIVQGSLPRAVREDVVDQVVLALAATVHGITLGRVLFLQPPRNPASRLIRFLVVSFPLLVLVYFPFWRSYFFSNMASPGERQEAHLFARILVDPVIGTLFGVTFGGVAVMFSNMIERLIQIFGGRRQPRQEMV